MIGIFPNRPHLIPALAWLIAVSMLSAGTAFAQDDQSKSGDDASASERIADDVQDAIYQQINAYRAEQGLPKLERDQELIKAASDFARFMAKTSKYGHYADGSTPARRAQDAGYKYCVVRENIAYRTNTGDVTRDRLIEVFVQGWIDSPPHKENIMADYVTETGVGVATEDGVTYYAVQLFGRPRSAAFKVQVTNQADGARTLIVESDGNRDDFDLPPRSRVRITRCLPAELSLADGEATFQLSEPAELVIRQDGLERISSQP